MKYLKLGNSEEKVSALGLGCMPMSHAYGVKDDKESIATLYKALDLGINFWDTADFYGNGENERLISKVLKENRSKIFIATKFGFRYEEGSDLFASKLDASPQWMQKAVEASLKRLGVDCIDLYYAHRVDPQVPIEETVGAMSDLVKQGKVRYLGLSEASTASIRKAHAIHPITALQSEYSLLSRNIEKEILPLLKELRITLVPFSPLGRGMFTDNFESICSLQETDPRRNLPRFQGECLDNNLKLMKALQKIAQKMNISLAQLALSWIYNKWDNVIPIPGTKKRKYLIENSASVDIALRNSEIKEIENCIAKYPHIGERYNESSLKLTNH